ncbi:MAG: DUF192 domain-containing protein [Acidobacteria bacterium]|nr:DUF192 domain-containing protein [Acidobacteriota bacterium]
MSINTISLFYNDGSVVERPLISCNTIWTRAWGMLGVRSETNEAYRIVPCSSIHTFFMAFPIDAIFVNREGMVLKAKNVPPFRLFSCPGAWAVVEGTGLIKENKALERISEWDYNQLK